MVEAKGGIGLYYLLFSMDAHACHLACSARTAFHLSAFSNFHLFYISRDENCAQETSRTISPTWSKRVLWILDPDRWYFPVHIKYQRLCQFTKQPLHQRAL